MNTDKLEPAAQSDADTARTAQSVLQWTPLLPPGCVKVKVENGWITLSGNVEWEFQKKAAVRAVHHLAGVSGVSDMMTIDSTVANAGHGPRGSAYQLDVVDNMTVAS